MIVYIDCPACGQKHGIYLSGQLLQGKILRTPCPITHQMLFIRVKITVEMEASFEKSDLQVAEETAKFSDYQWRTEEDVNKDTNQ